MQDHKDEFPILSTLAKYCLCCLSRSSSVQRCFSAAADVCSQDRGRLNARTIKRCIGAHQWLANGIKANGEFEEAQRIINDSCNKNDTRYNRKNDH